MNYPAALGTAIATLLSGCVAAPPASVGSSLTGSWGENADDCRGNPHTIHFSAQGDVMHVRYPEGGTADGKSLQEHFSYRVLGRTPTGLRLALIGEPRLDSSSRAVTWEIRQSGEDNYCWWRSDWPSNECTVPRIHCEL